MANEAFESFIGSQTVNSCIEQFCRMCECLGIESSGQSYSQFFGLLKKTLLTKPPVTNYSPNTCNVRAHRQHNNNWKVSSILHKIHLRASNTSSYGGNNLLKDHEVLIMGGGPCGLRAAIEMQLLGARRVTVVEKRDTFSRFNVIRLWPCVIDDLKALGAKKIYGRFCAGSIDHVSIRQLQLILLKVALLCGVRVVVNAKFESLCPRSLHTNSSESDCSCPVDIGYGHAHFTGSNAHLVKDLPFTILIGADGRRNSLSRDFPRKEFRGRLAIAITANFDNTRSVAEARVEEISGTSYIYNQQWFKELHADTGIELENFTYYKDETHFVVMTATKNSLLQRGVLLHDHSDTNALLSPDNISRPSLLQYARDATEWTTGLCQPFVHNHNGVEDVQIFDFTSMYAAENACKVKRLRYNDETQENKYLLMGLVGDALLEPFWPIGSGLGRGFLSAFDSAWMAREWVTQGHQDETRVLSVLAQRESIYKILSQTTAENVSKTNWTLNPQSRYTNLNSACTISSDQVIHLLYENLRKPVSSVAAKRARRATVAVSGADLNRAANYEIRPKHEWLYNKVYDYRNDKSHKENRVMGKCDNIVEENEKLNDYESNEEKPHMSDQNRYKHDWLLGRVDHEAIGKLIMNQYRNEMNDDDNGGVDTRQETGGMKSRIKDLEFKLKKSRGLLNEEQDRMYGKKSHVIADRAEELEKMFDETKKPIRSKSPLNKVGHIEQDDWNVKCWNERLKAPSPTPLISRPSPRPEKQIEVFNSKVQQASEMLLQLDCDPLSAGKNRKVSPTRDWVAKIQSELVSRQQPSAPKAQSPQKIHVNPCAKRVPQQQVQPQPKSKPQPQLCEMKPQMPLTIIEHSQEPIMNPLMTSQSETHIQSRPECSRCHAPINNTWERIIVNGILLHRSCLYCSVCRVHLRLSEVRNTQNFTCVICSSNNNNTRSMNDIHNAKRQWITNIEKVDYRGGHNPDVMQQSDSKLRDTTNDVTDVPDTNNHESNCDYTLNASESSSSDESTTSTTDEDEDDDGDEEDSDKENDEDYEEEEEVLNGDTDSDVTWDSESDSDSDLNEKFHSNIDVPAICVTSDTGFERPLSPLPPLTPPKITQIPPQPLTESLSKINDNAIPVPKPPDTVQRIQLPRFSYTGSFTEKMLQRSHSQPSLFRTRPFPHLTVLTKHYDDDTELQFADATTNTSTFSPMKRHSQLAPLITLEDV